MMKEWVILSFQWYERKTMYRYRYELNLLVSVNQPPTDERFVHFDWFLGSVYFQPLLINWRIFFRFFKQHQAVYSALHILFGYCWMIVLNWNAIVLCIVFIICVCLITRILLKVDSQYLKHLEAQKKKHFLINDNIIAI